MEITWLGTAGFRIRTKSACFLTDPFISCSKDRSQEADPAADDFSDAGQIFISHGHFDHIYDVPALAAASGARIFCSSTAARTLEKLGVPKNRIACVTGDAARFDLDSFSARAFFSRHIHFDFRLMVSILARARFSLLRLIPLLLLYPCGRVIAWEFIVENRRLLFFGSAGNRSRSIEALAGSPVDILFLPLQGHSRICDIGLEYVRILKPELVFPCHHDDFYPPLSQAVDITSFLDAISAVSPGTRAVTPAAGCPLTV